MIGSLTDLAARPGMPSDVTLRKMIRRNPDFPIVRVGTHGRRYEIDLDEAERFVRALRARPSLDRAAMRAFLNDFGLTISNEAALKAIGHE